MTRLFRVEENGTYQEVETTERLAGIYDAILIAERSGDGSYVYDHENGQFQELQVASGKMQQFAHDSVKEGTPGQDFDKSRMQETISSTVSAVGGTFLPSDGIVGRPLDETRPAVEEF
jgi:hypothetical protein